MNLRFASLLSNVLNWPQSAKRKSRPAHARRRLLGEQLETRYALTGDLDPPPDILPPGPGTPPPEISPPNDPGTGGTGTVDPGTGGGTPTPPTNAPPVFSDFTFVLDGNWITLTGTVSDDQDPTNYVVNIWGIVNGSVAVGSDHRFSIRFAFSPDYSGSITAETHDIYGLLAMATITV